MPARKAAFSVVVRPHLSNHVCALLMSLALAMTAVGCKKGDVDASHRAVATPVVKDLSDGLQLTWIDDKGEFHVEERVADVPPASRDAVRVRVLESATDPGADRVFVADLRNAGPDGSYPVQAMPRAQFEDIAVARRAKSGTAVLAPKAAASVAAAGTQGQDGTGNPGSAGEVAGRPAVIIYGASWCGPCHQAAAYLKKKGVAFVEHDIEQDSASQHEMQAKLAKAGMRAGSIPVLDVRGKILVGFDARAVDQALGTAL
ncbi:MAG: hypothetical protein NVS3B10_31520 [Polyangiales bacterium]